MMFGGAERRIVRSTSANKYTMEWSRISAISFRMWGGGGVRVERKYPISTGQLNVVYGDVFDAQQDRAHSTRSDSEGWRESTIEFIEND